MYRLCTDLCRSCWGEVADHILEGKSLLPILRGEAQDVGRDYVICEYDYSASPIATKLGINVRDGVMFMVANKEWKLIHCEGGFRPILYDLANDPDELVDLGDSTDHADVIATMYDKLFAWARRPSQRTTRSSEQLIKMRTETGRAGVIIGVYDENDVPLELTVNYRNKKVSNHKGSRAPKT